jgi:hypothetical protein
MLLKKYVTLEYNSLHTSLCIPDDSPVCPKYVARLHKNIDQIVIRLIICEIPLKTHI